MAQEKSILDTEAVERLPFCIPVVKPMPIPQVAWNEEPTRCMRINAEWCSHILGALECLDQPDAWQGTEAEIFDARQQVREIMLAVMTETECIEPVESYVKFIGDCNEEGLLVTQVISGVESTARIDISSCIPQVTDYIKTFSECDNGQLEFTEVNGGVETQVFLNLSVCLEGQFLTNADIPPAFLTGLECDDGTFLYHAWSKPTGEQEIVFDLAGCVPVPVPSLVGDDLVFDMGSGSLNVGRVVYPGSDGADGADAPIPGVFLSAGDLYFDANGDDIYDNLGHVKGDTGEPGECLGCEAMPVPPITDDPSNDGLQCSIAINEAKYLRSIWDKAYNDTDGFVTGYINALITGASVLAYFFPGAAVASFIGGLLLSLLKGINQLEANEFDNEFEEKIRCDLYCILKDNDTTVISTAIITEWAAAIRTGSNIYEAYAADLVEYTPISEFQWTAYASSAVDPAACLSCECEGEPGLCDGLHIMTVNAAVPTEQSSNFTLPVGCCYVLSWSGNVRVGGTVGSPLMGDGARQQVTAGSWASNTFSGDVLGWNATTGGTWSRLPSGITYNPAGYSISIPSQGTPLRVRWSAANYGNNSGNMTVTVQGEEC